MDMETQRKIVMLVFGAVVIIILALAIYGYLSGSWEATDAVR